ncbi:MAG: serpin family protein [Bacteroidota bacterium]
MKVGFAMVTMALMIVLVFGFSGLLLGSGETDQADLAAVVKGNNAFAFELYSVIAKEKGNLFLSPFSITSALAMTYAGARGETARQMEKTLHFDLAGANLNPGFAELMKKFNASDKSYQLSVANALWGQQGTEFFPKFTEITKKYYDAGFKEVDYIHNTEHARQTINYWVETKTNHKIKELIKPNILNALTRLVLTNAIYFKGRWEWQFKPEQTKQAPFHVSAEAKPNVPMMYQLGKFKYAETDQSQILELPYSGGEIAMDILLPKPDSSLAKLESNLQSSNFETWLDQMSMMKVAVFLPRFKLEKEFLLGNYLQSLGMKNAFDENAADFSGMSKTFLYITHVIHKAFVDVNEEGTEAAAATAVVMGTKAAMIDEPVTFRADHPSIFLIRDTRSGSILFMGRVADPRG